MSNGARVPKLWLQFIGVRVIMYAMLATAPSIAVIGTINRDTVVRADGVRNEGFGGILYNLIALSKLLPDARLLPVTNLGEDLAATIRPQLQLLDGIDFTAVRSVPRRHNHCLLRYHDIAAKTEILRGWVGAVARRQLRPILASDFILVNFISGSDISTHNLRWLRANSAATIYLDYHSRTLGRTASGRRYLRRPRDWRDTVCCADFLQMNEVEFEVLADKPVTPTSAQQFFTNYLVHTCRALIVTLGASGCLCVHSKGSAILASMLPIRRRTQAVDTTGCGDIFSAAFLAAYAIYPNPLPAADFARKTASARAAVSKAEDLNWRAIRSSLRELRAKKADFQQPLRMK